MSSSLRLRGATLCVGALLFLLRMPSSSAADSLATPRAVEFVPSAHHNVTLPDGTSAVTSYVLEIYLLGATAPFHVVDLGKPGPEADGRVRYDFSSGLASWPLPGGTYEARVASVGPRGTSRSIPSNSFTVPDTTAPETTLTSWPTSPNNSPAAGFLFAGTDAGSGVGGFECALDGSSFIACLSGVSYVGLPDGSHTLNARAIDLAGNVDASPASYTWTIDTQAPDTAIDRGPATTTPSRTAEFGFSGSDAGAGVATFECALDGGVFGDCTSGVTYAGLSIGAHTFDVRAVDAVGNVDATSAHHVWTVEKAWATVMLSSLTQTYSGAALTPTATTVPADLAIVWTNAPKTAAGTYVVTATVDDPSYQGFSSGTFVIRKMAATVTLLGLMQTYTGSPLTPTATTLPEGLPLTWTNAPQTNAGTYAVTATVSDPVYEGTATGTFVVGKKSAAITLSKLTQTYTGTPLTPTATTVPAGLALVWTNAPQTNAGTYAVTAAVNDPAYGGIASGTFVIAKKTATLSLSKLTQTYTGNPLTPTATTTPAGLAVVWTNAPQTSAGSYAVTATVDDPNYQRTASGTFVIAKKAATITVSNLTQTYTGSPLTPTATTLPAGLRIVWTNAPQTEPGSYAVTATIDDANYKGTASRTFVIAKKTATITVSNLTQTYTGSPLTPTATTLPAGLRIVWTNAPQTEPGSYAVIATIDDPYYKGTASRTFVIAKKTTTITVSNLTQTYTGSPLTPTATTVPAGLRIVWTNAPQTSAGSYLVTATIDDPYYKGTTSRTFVIEPPTQTAP